MTLTAPISYQGGKSRIAAAILDRIDPCSAPFHDLCCGCGAVSIELVNRGQRPDSIVMLDAGPWGMFWEAVGNGTFDVDRFMCWCQGLPPQPDRIAGYLKQLSTNPVDKEAVYVFLLLQAGAFGGKAIWIKDGCWKNTTFRSYWQPTATSSRRSPVNPMMPMPDTLIARVTEVCQRMRGVRGLCSDIHNYRPAAGHVYIDPPYAGTTAYGHTFDVLEYVRSLRRPCYVSEGRALSEQAWLISSGRAKGGISGDRKKSANEEWLSLVNKWQVH